MSRISRETNVDAAHHWTLVRYAVLLLRNPGTRSMRLRAINFSKMRLTLFSEPIWQISRATLFVIYDEPGWNADDAAPVCSRCSPRRWSRRARVLWMPPSTSTSTSRRASDDAKSTMYIARSRLGGGRRHRDSRPAAQTITALLGGFGRAVAFCTAGVSLPIGRTKHDTALRS